MCSDFGFSFLVANDGTETSEVRKAKIFLAETFLKMTETSVGRKRPKGQEVNRECFLHYTTAVDTANINRVFNDCRNIILRWHLEHYDLL